MQRTKRATRSQNDNFQRNKSEESFSKLRDEIIEHAEYRRDNSLATEQFEILFPLFRP